MMMDSSDYMDHQEVGHFSSSNSGDGLSTKKTFDAKLDSSQQQHQGLFSFLTAKDHTRLVYLTVLALIVRLAFLSHPSVVIFDEVHFGGFAKKYLTGEFFNDLHPPLARLLVALSAWIGGFDAKFNFYDIGADYVSARVPYIMMRLFTAISGVAVIPMAYVTMRALSLNCNTSTAISTMLIFENALVTQSRFILLDAYLVLFTAAVPLSWSLFERQRLAPFSRAWKASLFLLGLSIALAASCKWVGLFAVVAVGLYTISDLWRILGDRSTSLRDFALHFMYRAHFLIVVPAVIYGFTFWLHFGMQTVHSPSAASFSIEFQQSLYGGELAPAMKQLYYGSIIRLRQDRSEGAFLHSHAHMYPEGSKQQQVTGYHHRDSNNLWMIRHALEKDGEPDSPFDEEDTLRPVHHGDVIRLEHLATGRFLHSHPLAPPISNKDKQFEVSAYGLITEGASDSNDNWRIELVDSNGDSITADDDELPVEERPKRVKQPVHAVIGRFRLTHTNLQCKLHCRNKPLPDWGFKQSEVTCGAETLRSNQIWLVESNVHPLVDRYQHPENYDVKELEQIKDQLAMVPSAALETAVVPRMSFWQKLVEMNLRMWKTNASLSADHPFASRPQSWPLLSRGLGFWNGAHVPKTAKEHARIKEAEAQGLKTKGEVVDEEDQLEKARLTKMYEKFKGQQVYLIGNPVVFWLSTGSIGLLFVLLLVYRGSQRRGLFLARYFENSSFARHLSWQGPAGFLVTQWLWHYIPFFGMQRQLFLHHYLPALYFAVLLFAVLLDAVLDEICDLCRLSEGRAMRLKNFVLGSLVVSTVLVFVALAPLAYGLRMSRSHCEWIKWLPRWDFDCNNLVDVAQQVAITSD